MCHHDGIGIADDAGSDSKTLEQAQAVAEQFQQLVTTEIVLDDESLGDLAAFAGVRELPSRIKCALLPWRALKRALQAKSPHEGG